MPNGPMKITGVPLDLDMFDSEHSIADEDLKVYHRCTQSPLNFYGQVFSNAWLRLSCRLC